jgi:hypothetical protein
VRPHFGTVWGENSVGELHDLMIAKDQEMAALESAWRAYDSAWMGYDAPTDNAWIADFNALKARYGAARDRANQKIAVAAATPGQPDSQIPAGPEYKALLAAVQKTSGVTAPGDLQDLWNRLQNAMTTHALATGQKPPMIQEPHIWQPVKGGDADLNAIQSNRGALSLLASSVGLPPIPPAGPPKKTSTTKLLALGGALTLGLIAAIKIGWKVVKPF